MKLPELNLFINNFNPASPDELMLSLNGQLQVVMNIDGYHNNPIKTGVTLYDYIIPYTTMAGITPDELPNTPINRWLKGVCINPSKLTLIKSNKWRTGLNSDKVITHLRIQLGLYKLHNDNEDEVKLSSVNYNKGVWYLSALHGTGVILDILDLLVVMDYTIRNCITKPDVWRRLLLDITNQVIIS